MKLLLNFLINPLLSIIAILMTFIHYIIVAIPFYMALIPVIKYIKEHNLTYIPNNLFVYILFGMFFFTLLYLLFDLIFGFTIKNIIKNTHEIKELENFEVQQEIFDEVIDKFDIKNVKFMIEESDEINAYAVASFRKKYVVITTSMLDHILESFETVEERREALKGLIGHELSHLINWDFLPNLILLSGENVSINIQNSFLVVVNLLASFLRIIPLVGPFLSLLTIYTYNFFTYLLLYSYKYLLRPLYNLMERYLSRKVEYRCDYQSSQVLGWESIYLTLYTLLSLNGSTYHSPFSTHPNTISRILNIYNSKSAKKKISVNFLSKYFGILILILISSSIVYLYMNTYNSVNLLINNINKNFDNVSSTVTSYVLNIKTNLYAIFNFEYANINILFEEYNNLYLLSLTILVLFISYLFIRKIVLSLKLNYIKKKINIEVNTPIDILLLYAIKNNDVNSFFEILKHGANIKSSSFTDDIFSFTKENNPKFLKYLNKILEV